MDFREEALGASTVAVFPEAFMEAVFPEAEASMEEAAGKSNEVPSGSMPDGASSGGLHRRSGQLK